MQGFEFVAAAGFEKRGIGLLEVLDQTLGVPRQGQRDPPAPSAMSTFIATAFILRIIHSHCCATIAWRWIPLVFIFRGLLDQGAACMFDDRDQILARLLDLLSRCASSSSAYF